MKYLRLMVAAALLIFLQQGYAATFTGSGEIKDIDGDLDSTVDDLAIGQFTFTVATAGVVTIESIISGFDSYMYLYDSGSNIVAENDDASVSTLASGIETTLTAGTYMVAIGASWFSPIDGLLGYDDNWSFDYVAMGGAEVGTWSLTINTPTEVPLPGAFPLMMSALLLVGSVKRKFLKV